MAKVIGSETYNGLADEALQVYGGNGYSEEYPAARWYRDSRITRIYEGTSEICRLSIAKTILRRADRGQLPLRDAVAELTPAAVDRVGDSLTSRRAQVEAFKQVFLFVLGEVWSGVDDAELLEPGRQQLLGSLADIAIETYLAESTVLRVLKQTEARPTPTSRWRPRWHNSSSSAPPTACGKRPRRYSRRCSRATNSRPPSTRVAGWLPAPMGLVETRALIARSLIGPQRLTEPLERLPPPVSNLSQVAKKRHASVSRRGVRLARRKEGAARARGFGAPASAAWGSGRSPV